MINSPFGSYPTQVTSISILSRNILRTLISPLVNVPVLSEQIILVEPRVSTLLNLLTKALRLTIRLVPKARQMVITAGNASGTAATAKAIAQINIFNIGYPL